MLPCRLISFRLVVFGVFFAVVAGIVWVGYYRVWHDDVRRAKCRDNLRNMHLLLSVYAQQYGAFPSMQPPQRRYLRSGGAQDLYPLWSTGIMKNEQLAQLQPPGLTLRRFSANPTAEHFNSNHIGFAYNSTVHPDQADNPPLLASQGVAAGVIGPHAYALVLFLNGEICEIPADADGRLNTERIKPEEWRQLAD